MRNYFKLFMTGALLTVMTSCYFNVPCIEGVGDVIEETRDVSDFSNISNNTSFDVYVTQADAYSVKVVAKENLLPIIETSNAGGTLIIEIKNFACIRNSNQVEVYVSLPEIDELKLSGSGTIIAGELESETLELAVAGSGLIQLDSVYTDDAIITVSGSGDVDILKTECEYLDVKLSSSGKIDFGVSAPLDALISVSGSGNVSGEIYDALKTDVRMSGSGKVELYGNSGDVNTLLSGSGRIDLLDLIAVDVTTKTSGSGSTYVNASGILDITISASGDVFYAGEPTILSRITGSGEIIKF